MRLGHLHLKVTDLHAAEQFYCRVLGLQVKERVGETFVFLSFGPAHHDVALQAISSSSHANNRNGAHNSPGLYHSAFEVASAAELEKAIRALAAESTPYTLIDHRISWAVYTEDPSGNGVEIYLDRRSAPDGAHVWNGKSAYVSEETVRAAAARNQ
jgi:catechol 2,3-dioxygenase